jgi:hypothetical protein
VLKNHQQLSKFVGADKASLARLPKGDRAEDPEAWKEIDKVLGVPDAPDGYGAYTREDGKSLVTEDELKGFYDRMHKAGASERVVREALDYLHDTGLAAGEQQAAADAAYEADMEKGLQALKGEWSGDFESRATAAEKAIAALPEADDFVSLLKDAEMLRHPAVLKFGDQLAKAFAESGAPVRGDGAKGRLSADQARAAITAFESNETKMKAWRAGNPAAVQEYTDLHKAAMPG